MSPPDFPALSLEQRLVVAIALLGFSSGLGWLVAGLEWWWKAVVWLYTVKWMLVLINARPSHPGQRP